MKFNKNFANVYTPYHEFEIVIQTLDEKKLNRQNKKRHVK